jgi:hypothetical protein
VPAVELAYKIREKPESFQGMVAEYTCQVVGDLINDFSFAKDPKDPVSS